MNLLRQCLGTSALLFVSQLTFAQEPKDTLPPAPEGKAWKLVWHDEFDPPELDFFSKQAVYEGIPIKAHKDVDDKALLEAHRRLSRMLENLPVARQNLVDVGAELQIIGKDQQTSDLPSERHWRGKPYETHGSTSLTIDQRTRGVGGLPASCGEENLLKLFLDRYKDHRDICTHEFAHTVLDYGFSPNVREMLRAQYQKSVDKGLWKTAYASTNPHEFFAELSMWYFDSRGDFGKIKPTPKEGREWFRKYDPDAYELLDRIYSGRVKMERIARETLVARPPGHENTLRSIASDHATTVLFDNRTPNELSLFWLDPQGKRKPYGTVRPGQKHFQNTFASHPWVVTKPDGKVAGVYVAGETNGRAIVADNPPAFIIGADISWVQQQEDEGVRFSDQGVQKDIFAILKDYQFNWIRLRVFCNPKAEKGYSKKAYCDLPHTLQMAKRIKAAGMRFLLDFHYSDNWADPGHQVKPAAWADLHGAELEKSVHDYTRDVGAALKKQGTTPDIVQIGNEISNGFLWPDGNVWKTGKWDVFCGLIKAGIAGAKEADPSVKIMLHLAWGGQNAQSRSFLDKAVAQGVEFDIIGQSYYPKWHGTLDDLKANLTDLAGRYKQDIVVVEYSVPNMRQINDIVHGLPGGKGLGTFIWEPTKWEGPALFDAKGNTKPEIDVYTRMAEDYGKGAGVRPASAQYCLYWGDVHGHTDLSDGKGSLDDYFTHAQDVAKLDFVVVSDHDFGGGPPWRMPKEKWKLTQDKADQYTVNGKFVAIAGYEWTSQPKYWTPEEPLFKGPAKYYNHKNVYFPSRVDYIFSAKDAAYNNPNLLAQAVMKHGGLIQNNHPIGEECRDQWDYTAVCESVIVNTEMGPNVMRYGGKEYKPDWEANVREFLNLGRKTGFVAGTDTHEGEPAARTAVLATELTRPAIFEALQHRRNYAVSSAKIVLDFKIDGHFMGEEIEVQSKPRIVAEVQGTDKIEEVVVVRDGSVIHSLNPTAKTAQLDFVDNSFPGNGYYYVRVIQVDKDKHGNRSHAWSSPIWVRKKR